MFVGLFALGQESHHGLLGLQTSITWNFGGSTRYNEVWMRGMHRSRSSLYKFALLRIAVPYYNIRAPRELSLKGES